MDYRFKGEFDHFDIEMFGSEFPTDTRLESSEDAEIAASETGRETPLDNVDFILLAGQLDVDSFDSLDGINQ